MRRSRERPDGIIAWLPDRLARNMRDAGEVIELLDSGQLTDLRFVMYSFHNDSSGKEHLAMEFARAKAYSDHLQDNVLRGLIGQEMRGRGTRPLPPAFTVIEDEDSPDYLKIIPSKVHRHWRNAYRWKLDGKTNEEIAALLVRDGYEAYYRRNGKRRRVRVDADYVGRHLKNPLHCGLFVAGEGSREPRRADLNELYPKEFGGEPFPIVVTVEDFKRVNPRLFSDTAGWRRPKRRSGYPLAGKVLCKVLHDSGRLATMTGATPLGGSGRPSPRFMCQRCRPQHSINMARLFAAVEKKLGEVRLTEREHKLLIVTEWARYQAEREAAEATRRQLAAVKGANEADIRRTQEELNTMKYGRPRAPAEEVAVQEAKLGRLYAEQKDLLARETALNEAGIARYDELDAFLELARNAALWWRKADDERKRKMAELLLLHVVVDPAGTATVSLAEPFAGWAKRAKNDDGGPRAVQLERLRQFYREHRHLGKRYAEIVRTFQPEYAPWTAAELTKLSRTLARFI